MLLERHCRACGTRHLAVRLHPPDRGFPPRDRTQITGTCGETPTLGPPKPVKKEVTRHIFSATDLPWRENLSDHPGKSVMVGDWMFPGSGSETWLRLSFRTGIGATARAFGCVDATVDRKLRSHFQGLGMDGLSLAGLTATIGETRGFRTNFPEHLSTGLGSRCCVGALIGAGTSGCRTVGAASLSARSGGTILCSF